MPEVRELSEALSEMSMDPITGVGVVASRNRAPTGYDVVSHLQSPWRRSEVRGPDSWPGRHGDELRLSSRFLQRQTALMPTCGRTGFSNPR